METETMKYQDDELEDGEVTDSDEVYTPLQRPDTTPEIYNKSLTSDPIKMEEALEYIEDSPSDFGQSTDSSSGSDEGLKAASTLTNCSVGAKKKKKKRAVLLRDKQPISSTQQEKQAKFKKYNIWTASLQEESLMENMRGIDVAKNPKFDRNVESYDFSLKYRLNGEGAMKRRLSTTSGDEFSDNAYCQLNKKLKSGPSRPRKCAKKRLGRRESTSSCDSQNAPRYILDLTVGPENESGEIARDIANKLCEEKDDLLIRVLDVLGKKLPIEIFKETQRIERDGGMMIMNGMRRRTPGGVFLFLIKHHDDISAEDKKLIFHEDVKKTFKERKGMQATKRDQKVEELKKRLNLQQKELPPLSTRAEVMSRLIPADSHATLSNPPPSPVNNTGQENSPEYSAHAINHVSDVSPDKTTLKSLNDLDDDNLVSYENDFLDMNYEDVDMF